MKGSPIESFFVALGFDVEEKGATEFVGLLNNVRNLTLAAGAAIVGAGAALAGFTIHVAETVDELGDFAEQEQVSIEAIQELGHAAQLHGSSVEAVKNSIGGLNRVMGEAILGIGRGAKVFEHLGLEAKDSEGKVKTFDAILEEVADKMQGLSRQEQVAMAEKLGIDRSLIPLLTSGREEIQKLRAEARAFGIVTEEEAKKAGALADSLDRTKFLLGAISDELGLQMAPAVQDASDKFRDFLMKNREFIKLNIERFVNFITGAVGLLTDAVSALVEAIVGAVKWLLDFKAATWLAIFALMAFSGLAIISMVRTLGLALMAAARAFMALNFQAMIIPALLGAIVAAIALVIEDIYQWKQGNDSVVGDIIAKYPVVKGYIDSIAQSVQSIVSAYDAAVNSVSRFIESVANGVEMVRSMASAASNIFSLGFGGGASMRLPNIPNVAAAGQIGRGAASGGSTSNQTTNVNGVNIHIKTSDPVKAGKAAGAAVGGLNKNTTRNTKTAVVQ